MDKALKRKIRRMWCDRLLMSVGAIFILGVSVLQLQAVLRHRPQQPQWALELAQQIEVLTDKNSSSEEQAFAISEIREIAREKQLKVTAAWGRALDLELERELALALALELMWERALDLDVDLELARGRTLGWRAQAWIHELALEREHVWALKLGRELELERASERASERAVARALSLERVSERALSPLEWRQAWIHEQEQEREQVWALAQDLALERARELSNLILPLVEIELTHVHGLRLKQGRDLEYFQSAESGRARALLQAGILLGLSVFVLFALLILMVGFFAQPLKKVSFATRQLRLIE